MILRNLPDLGVNDYVKNIIQSNRAISYLIENSETLNILIVFKKRQSHSVILEISPKVRSQILNQRGIKIGFLMTSVKTILTGCTKCCMYVHITSRRTESQICSWCMGIHIYENCP